MISEVVKERMEVIGLTQAKLAESIGCTPTQLGLFLQDKASLNRTSLDKCFQTLGINIDAISKRIRLAKEIAKILKGFSVEQIASMTRTEMLKITERPEIEAFPVVSESEFKIMVSSGVADYESTFQYFKALVLYFVNSPEKPTPKTAEKSLSILAGVLIAAPFMPFLGVGTVIGAAIGALAAKNSYLRKAVNTAWGPILTLTMGLFEREKHE